MKMQLTPLVFLLLASCSDDLISDVLFRTMDDPFDDTPIVDSLSREHSSSLSWKNDEACDNFRLMRSYDTSPLCFTCIYEGTGTEYTDLDMGDKERHIYRLDKTRGKKTFIGGEYAYGFSADCRGDECEPNDEEECATPLSHDLVCNLPCVKFETDGKRLIDADWFSVEIPPQRSVEIIIAQHGLANESTGTATNLKIQVSGFESESVKQKVAQVISNTSHEAKVFRFRIYPETTELFSSNTSIALIEYTVSLGMTYKYSL